MCGLYFDILKADKNVRKLKTNKRKLKSQAVDFNGKLLFYFHS